VGIGAFSGLRAGRHVEAKMRDVKSVYVIDRSPIGEDTASYGLRGFERALWRDAIFDILLVTALCAVAAWLLWG
jgi:hypothetical protein